VSADTTPVDHRAAALHASIACAHLAAHLDPDLRITICIHRASIEVQLISGGNTDRVVGLQDLTRLADALGLAERDNHLGGDQKFRHHEYTGAFHGFTVRVTWLEKVTTSVPPLTEEHVEQLLVDAGVPPRSDQVAGTPEGGAE
jgi:hypothetical protein